MKLYILSFCLVLCTITFGQTSIMAIDVPSITNAGEGDLYLTTDTSELYIGLTNGNLMQIGITAFVAKHAEYQFPSTISISVANGFRDFFTTEVSNEGAVTKTNNSTITVNETGLYHISFNCRLDGNGFLIPAVAELYINGVFTKVYADNGLVYYGSNSISSWNFDYVSRIDAGQTVRIATSKPSGGYAGTLLAQPNYATFTITKIGD